MEENDQIKNNETIAENSQPIEENEITEDKTILLDEEKKMTLIGNKEYDEDTLNRITIVRLTQKKIPQSEIRKLLDVSKALVSKWANYDKRKPKTMGRPPKFTDEQKDFIYKTSEGKMAIINKVSARNIAIQFSNKFHETISKSSVNNFLLKKFGKPYRGVNSILLTEEHIHQRLEFSNEIINNNIKSSDIIFTDECRIVLFPKVNPKINVIRLNENDKKNIHTYEVNKKKTFFRPKFETSVMVAGGITKYGLSNLVFCSGAMNNFSYKQFLLFQQDNASCHKNRESIEAL